MKENTTELVFILDRSGSMANLVDDTIGGFNSMLAKQKALEAPCRITTVLFDNYVELLHDRVDMEAVSPISVKEYFVRGCTALMDAIGTAVEKIELIQKNTAPQYRAQRIMFVIITDGAENSSRKYSSSQIKAKISQHSEADGWEFIFLGANIDAVETAARMGIKADRAANYVPDQKGTALNFNAMSDAVGHFRTCPAKEVCACVAPSLANIRADMDARGNQKKGGDK